MEAELTSLQNPRIKRVVKLRQKRVRERESAFLIEGYREITRAAEMALPMQEVYVCSAFFQGHDEPALVERVRTACGAQVQPTSEAVFGKLSYRDRPDGLLAVAAMPDWPLTALRTPERGLYVVATSIEKPGNLGTILRSADAVGVDGVIVCDAVTDVFNPNVVRASVGTLFTVPVAIASAAEAVAWLRTHGVRIIATTPGAEFDYTVCDLTGAVAIVLGSEHEGLDATWLEAADEPVRIPMRGHADSINVAMTATVMLFEAERQRSKPPRTAEREP